MRWSLYYIHSQTRPTLVHRICIFPYLRKIRLIIIMFPPLICAKFCSLASITGLHPRPPGWYIKLLILPWTFSRLHNNSIFSQSRYSTEFTCCVASCPRQELSRPFTAAQTAIPSRLGTRQKLPRPVTHRAKSCPVPPLVAATAAYLAAPFKFDQWQVSILVRFLFLLSKGVCWLNEYFELYRSFWWEKQFERENSFGVLTNWKVNWMNAVVWQWWQPMKTASALTYFYFIHITNLLISILADLFL